MIRSLFQSIRDNKVFFAGLSLYLVICAIIIQLTNQGDAIVFFSEHRSVFGDLFFKYVTKLGEHWPFLIAAICFLFIRYRYAIAVGLNAIVITLISSLSKRYFYHPRPKDFFEFTGQLDQINLIEGVHLISGHSSFPSGHTMAGFGIWGLIALLSKKKTWPAVIFVLAAILVGISRVYLVQHFVKDILLGALLGVIAALLVFYFQSIMTNKEDHWLNKSLLSPKTNPGYAKK